MSVDETFRQLEALLSADATRKAADFEQLKAITKRLDGGLLPADEPPLQGGERNRPARLTPGAPFVPLPSRTTHGGRFGPAVVARLRAEALARR